MSWTEEVRKALGSLDCDYAFYCRRAGEPPFSQMTRDRFRSASLLKVPILLAWLYLESCGEVSRAEICELDEEPQVMGAGLSWLLRGRMIPYQDVILLMIALSDNLCSNLVIRRAGLERLHEVITSVLGLEQTRLERRFMDYEARAHGLENWISAADCVRLFDLCRNLEPENREWVEAMLAANVDDGLLLRNIPRDTLTFYHKTGSMTGVLHDWGYTEKAEVFLLTESVVDETRVYAALDVLGPLALQSC